MNDYLGGMKLLLLLISTFSLACAYTQKNDVPAVVNLDGYTIEQKIKVPFRAIKVVDARFDQSNIGCVNKSASQTSFKHQKTTAVFPQPLEQYLPGLFSNLLTFEPEGQDTLLMLVKQFRITDHLFNGVNL